MSLSVNTKEVLKCSDIDISDQRSDCPSKNESFSDSCRFNGSTNNVSNENVEGGKQCTNHICPQSSGDVIFSCENTDTELKMDIDDIEKKHNGDEKNKISTDFCKSDYKSKVDDTTSTKSTVSVTKQISGDENGLSNSNIFDVSDSIQRFKSQSLFSKECSKLDTNINVGKAIQENMDMDKMQSDVKNCVDNLIKKICDENNSGNSNPVEQKGQNQGISVIETPIKEDTEMEILGENTECNDGRKTDNSEKCANIQLSEQDKCCGQGKENTEQSKVETQHTEIVCNTPDNASLNLNQDSSDTGISEGAHMESTTEKTHLSVSESMDTEEQPKAVSSVFAEVKESIEYSGLDDQDREGQDGNIEDERLNEEADSEDEVYVEVEDYCAESDSAAENPEDLGEYFEVDDSEDANSVVISSCKSISDGDTIVEDGKPMEVANSSSSNPLDSEVPSEIDEEDNIDENLLKAKELLKDIDSMAKQVEISKIASISKDSTLFLDDSSVEEIKEKHESSLMTDSETHHDESILKKIEVTGKFDETTNSMIIEDDLTKNKIIVTSVTTDSTTFTGDSTANNAKVTDVGSETTDLKIIQSNLSEKEKFAIVAIETTESTMDATVQQSDSTVKDVEMTDVVSAATVSTILEGDSTVNKVTLTNVPTVAADSMIIQSDSCENKMEVCDVDSATTNSRMLQGDSAVGEVEMSDVASVKADSMILQGSLTEKQNEVASVATSSELLSGDSTVKEVNDAASVVHDSTTLKPTEVTLNPLKVDSVCLNTSDEASHKSLVGKSENEAIKEKSDLSSGGSSDQSHLNDEISTLIDNTSSKVDSAQDQEKNTFESGERQTSDSPDSFDLDDDAINDFKLASSPTSQPKLSDEEDELDNLMKEFASEIKGKSAEESNILLSDNEEEVDELIEDFKVVESDDDCLIVDDADLPIILDDDEPQTTKTDQLKSCEKDDIKANTDKSPILKSKLTEGCNECLIAATKVCEIHKSQKLVSESKDILSNMITEVEKSNGNSSLPNNSIGLETEYKLKSKKEGVNLKQSETLGVNHVDDNSFADGAQEDTKKRKLDEDSIVLNTGPAKKSKEDKELNVNNLPENMANKKESDSFSDDVISKFRVNKIVLPMITKDLTRKHCLELFKKEIAHLQEVKREFTREISLAKEAVKKENENSILRLTTQNKTFGEYNFIPRFSVTFLG